MKFGNLYVPIFKKNIDDKSIHIFKVSTMDLVEIDDVVEECFKIVR